MRPSLGQPADSPPSLRGPYRRRLSLRLLGLALGCAMALVLLLLAELACRFFFPDSTASRPRISASEEDQLFQNVDDPLLGYVNTPNLHMILTKGDKGYLSDYSMTITTDENGFRTLPPPLRPSFPPDARPVLGVGDSVIFGSGVNDDETFLARLTLDYGVKTMNAGVMGYNTAQQWRLFQRVDAMRFRPRHVVLAFCPNDIELIIRQWSASDQALRILLPGERLAKPLRYSVIARRFANAFFAGATTGTKKAVVLNGVPLDVIDANISEPQRGMVQRHLLLFRDACVLGDATFTVLLFPRRQQLTRAPELAAVRSIQDWLGEWLEREGIAYIDLRPLLAEHAPDHIMRDSTHLTPFGHNLLASLLAERLGLVSQSGAPGDP